MTKNDHDSQKIDSPKMIALSAVRVIALSKTKVITFSKAKSHSPKMIALLAVKVIALSKAKRIALSITKTIALHIPNSDRPSSSQKMIAIPEKLTLPK